MAMHPRDDFRPTGFRISLYPQVLERVDGVAVPRPLSIGIAHAPKFQRLARSGPVARPPD